MALTVAVHRLRESSSPRLLPPIDQGWQGGPAVSRSAPWYFDRSECSSGLLTTLVNPLSLRVVAHLSLDSIRAKWWNPSSLAAWASPPQPENKSTAVRLTAVLSALSCLSELRLVTPSKRAVSASTASFAGGEIASTRGAAGASGSVGCVATPSLRVVVIEHPVPGRNVDTWVASTPSSRVMGDGGTACD